MAATVLKIWHDAAMTQAVDAENPIDLGDGEALQLYAGSPNTGLIHERLTLPGVNHLEVSIVDSNTGAGAPDTDIKLALTEVGLATATPGDPLDLGVEILSTVANGVSFFAQYDDSIGVTAEYTDVTLKILDAMDTPA
jgi:hypothetical protein